MSEFEAMQAPAWLKRAAERIEAEQVDVEGAISIAADRIEEIVLEELKADEPGSKPTYVAMVSKQVRELYNVPDDAMVADNVTIKTTVLHATHFGVHVVSPAIMHEFQVGGETDDDENHVVAKVCFIAPPDAMRDYAKIMFDAEPQCRRGGRGQRGANVG